MLIFIDVKPSHPPNALASILVTLPEISTFVSAIRFANAFAPILE